LNTIKAKGSAAISNWLKNASEMPEGRVVSSCELKESLLKEFLLFILYVAGILYIAVIAVIGILNEDTRWPAIAMIFALISLYISKDRIPENTADKVWSFFSATKTVGGWRFNKFMMVAGTIVVILSAVILLTPVELRNKLLMSGPFSATVAYAFLFLLYLFLMVCLIFLYWVYKRSIGKEKTVTVELVDGKQVMVKVPWYKYAAAKLHFCTFYDLSH
jgi:hypothetical protein